MSLLHIGVALCLSAAAAFLVTGATMRPIQPDCVAGNHPVRGEPACLPVHDGQAAAAPASSADAGEQNPGGPALASD
jgi:hypothetical protein